MVKFLVDESTGKLLNMLLIDAGYDAIFVGDWKPGALDTDILRKAYTENRIIVTDDKDFGELIVRRHFAHQGVLLFRLKDESLANVQTRLQYVLVHYHDQLHHFLVISQTRVRIRKTTQQAAA